MMRLVFWLALVIGLTEMAIGSVDFEVQGVHHSTSTPQLWYEGYWKHVRHLVPFVQCVKHDRGQRSKFPT